MYLLWLEERKHQWIGNKPYYKSISFLSSFNNSGEISQQENYTYCRKLYYIYYHKDDIAIAKNMKCYQADSIDTTEFSTDWMFHIHSLMCIYLGWYKQM